MLNFAFVETSVSKNSTYTSDDAFIFHKSLPNYQVSPLIKLENLAKDLGIKNILVKDESSRLDLNAFKVLGAIYAMAKYLANQCNLSEKQLDYNSIISCLKSKDKITFITATDGNHGKAVARAAKTFKQKAIVYLPESTAQARVEAIRNEGAKAIVLDKNYDQAVRQASLDAKEKGYILIQDTAFSDYKMIPRDIIRGYQTIVFELIGQLEQEVTHVFLQAGVGSFAASFIEAYINLFEYRPKFIIIEPDIANPYFKSAKKGSNDQATVVKGKLDTIMAGLACGVANPEVYPFIKKSASAYISACDDVAKIALRTLANPIGTDSLIKSGESGGIAIGVLKTILENKDYKFAQNKLKLNNQSVVLMVNTEGITDPKSYNDIINS